MKKILLTFISIIFLISFASAEIQTLGTFKQNTNINLIQTCDTCTYNNLTYIKLGNGTIINISASMTRDGSFYNYSLPFIHTSSIGAYIYNGEGDLDGTNKVWSINFFVTPSGFIDNVNYYWLILVLSVTIMFLGFKLGDGWVVILGTFGLYFLGIYTLFFGIVGVKDQITTNSFALIILATAGYISIKSGIEMIGDL